MSPLGLVCARPPRGGAAQRGGSSSVPAKRLNHPSKQKRLYPARGVPTTHQPLYTVKKTHPTPAAFAPQANQTAALAPALDYSILDVYSPTDTNRCLNQPKQTKGSTCVVLSSQTTALASCSLGQPSA
ncbi:MAG: hypothetical protein [Microvirus sp.]|nr:MAG: hypothetical protein [Microvirus sp.]